MGNIFLLHVYTQKLQINIYVHIKEYAQISLLWQMTENLLKISNTKITSNKVFWHVFVKQ